MNLGGNTNEKSFGYFISNYRSYCGVLFISNCNGMDIGDHI